jgi:hypothetical protein
MKPNNLLTQALKLKNQVTFSQVKRLVEIAREYQKENGELFLKAEARKKVEIVDSGGFFRFLSEVSGVRVKNFEDIQNYLDTDSRKENILFSTNSKSKNIHPFSKTLLIKKRGELPKLYKKEDLKALHIDKITAVENGESFLNIDEEMFDSEFFIYLGGNASTMAREFLKECEVEFFIDFDIVSLNFYEDFNLRAKSLYIPKDFDSLLEEFGNEELYKKQRRYLRKSYKKETNRVIELIKKHKKVLEQEVI